MSPSSCNRQPSSGKPSSMRLAGKNADIARQRSHEIRRRDIHARDEPHPCATNGCSKAARHQGSLCEAHYADSVLDKDVLPIIYQGCTRFLQHGKHDRIRWTYFRSKIATWINRYFDLSSPPSSPGTISRNYSYFRLERIQARPVYTQKTRRYAVMNLTY